MKRSTTTAAVLALCVAWLALPASAAETCATADQAKQIRAFYSENPGTMPPTAAQRLNLPEALVVSGLPADQAASTSADAFVDVWTAMNSWEKATFLIIKDANIFEIESTIGKGAPSETSDYYNIAYEQPVRGHLRPDLYSSISAVDLPSRNDGVARGVLFYNQEGASIFGVFMSGEGEPPSEEEVAKFDAVKALIESKPVLCAGP